MCGRDSQYRSSRSLLTVHTRLTPEGCQVLNRFLLARHQWLAALLADWPAAECREFARLISRFADDIDQHPADLDC
jgi:hypothetical protein